jgi:uncharacterized membrane protein
MPNTTRALRALMSIAWQQVFQNLSNYFQFILTPLCYYYRQFPLVRYGHSWKLSSKQILV